MEDEQNTEDLEKWYIELEEYTAEIRRQIEERKTLISHKDFLSLEKEQKKRKVKPKVEVVDKEKLDWLFNTL